MKNKKILISKKIKKPYFSVITVVKNDEKNIIQTLKSVKNQTYTNFEYIVIDGNSTDKTIKKLMRFKNQITYLLSEKDNGIYFAMNKGLKISKGKIIIFVNSGDMLTRHALKIIKKKFDYHKIDFVFGTVKRHYTKDTIIKHGFNRNKLKYNFDFATAHSTGFFLRKNIYKKLGFFNTSYKCSSDYDIYFKILLKMKLNGGYTKKNELIGIVPPGGFSSKISFFNHLIEETMIRIKNNQNIFLIILIFFNAVIKNLFKRVH